jgi:hypothetical protein
MSRQSDGRAAAVLTVPFEPKMRTFAQQIEIEIEQEGRKAIRIFELPRHDRQSAPQAITRRAIGKPTSEQPGVVDAAKVAEAALVIHYGDRNGIREEDTDDSTASTCGPR